MRLLIAIILTTLAASAAENKSLVLQSNPDSKIIKSPNAEAIKKAEKILSPETNTIPRTTVLDANASTLIRRAMDIEAGARTTTKAVTTSESPVATTTSSSTEKPSGKYFATIDRSYSSLENDSWADAAANLNEVMLYFYNERSLHGKDNALLDDYYEMSRAFSEYIAAGTMLDEAEQPNYSAARTSFEHARSSATRIKANLAAGDEAKALGEIADKFIKKIDTEITYINDMLHGASQD